MMEIVISMAGILKTILFLLVSIIYGCVLLDPFDGPAGKIQWFFFIFNEVATFCLIFGFITVKFVQ